MWRPILVYSVRVFFKVEQIWVVSDGSYRWIVSMSSAWLTTKLDRLRPRTVGTGAEELASNSDKSSTSSSSSGKKQMMTIWNKPQKKKKPRHEV